MPSNPDSFISPPVTDQLLKSLWTKYVSWCEESAALNALYHSPKYKNRISKLFKAIEKVQIIWRRLPDLDKDLLISNVLEEQSGLDLFCCEPRSFNKEWNTKLLDLTKIDEAFDQKLTAALADYAEFQLDRVRYFNGPPPLEAEKKLAKFMVDFWVTAGGAKSYSEPLKNWVADLVRRLRTYGKAHSCNEEIANRLKRSFNNFVRTTIQDTNSN